MSEREEHVRTVRNSVRVLKALRIEMEHRKRQGRSTPEELVELEKVNECIQRGEKLLGLEDHLRKR